MLVILTDKCSILSRHADCLFDLRACANCNSQGRPDRSHSAFLLRRVSRYWHRALVQFLVHPLARSTGSGHVLLPERRPRFAFHRRIRDDPAFRVELPSETIKRYLTAVKAVGGAIHNLVQEWTAEWLAGIFSDVDAEVRLRGMLEEVIWGNAIWYGVGGWATRGDSGRAMNADFFLCVSPLIPSNTRSTDLVPFFTRLPIKCTSRHISHLPAWSCSYGRRHIAFLSLQTRHTPIFQSPHATPNVSSSVYSMDDLPWQPLAANRGFLRGH